MKRLILILAAVLIAGSAFGTVPADPEHSVLWGSFRCVTVVDSFLVASTDDGLMVAQRNPVTGLYDQVNHLFLKSIPVKFKRYGNVLAVRTLSEIIYFVDLGNLPSPVMLGEADVGRAYTDFALHGEDLYVAMGYDGVWRYRLAQYADSGFVDSTLLPIHAIQIETRNDSLYVLDDYNGVLSFSLAGDGFGQFDRILWVPLRASSFTLGDSLVAVALAGSKQVLLVHPDQSMDSVTTLATPNDVVAIDSLVVVLDSTSRVTDIINRRTLLVTHLPNEATPLRGSQAIGLTGSTAPAVLYADYRGQLLSLEISQTALIVTPKRVYSGPEVITDFEYFDNRLYVSQIGRPVDILEIEPSGAPVFDTMLYAPLISATQLDQSMGRLLTLFPPVGAVFMTRYAFDSLFLDNYLDVDTSKVKGFAANHFTVNNHYTMVTWGSSRATVYALSDTLPIQALGTVTVNGLINSAIVARDWLAVATNKGLLFVYRLTTADVLEHKATLGLARNVTSLEYDDATKSLYAFSGDHVATVDLSAANPTIRIESTELDIRAVAFGDDRLYTIGDEGIGVFSRPQPGSTAFPAMLDRGGRAGTMIKALNDLVFASDGRALHIYDLRIPTVVDADVTLPTQVMLSPNYPNPFNPSTTIEYSLPSSGRVTVTITNLLGQEVAQLIDEAQTAGSHAVMWDGKTADQRPAATGIYFYSLVFDGRAETRKMLLVK